MNATLAEEYVYLSSGEVVTDVFRQHIWFLKPLLRRTNSAERQYFLRGARIPSTLVQGFGIMALN